MRCCCGVDKDETEDVDPKSIRLAVGAAAEVLAGVTDDERCCC